MTWAGLWLALKDVEQLLNAPYLFAKCTLLCIFSFFTQNYLFPGTKFRKVLNFNTSRNYFSEVLITLPRNNFLEVPTHYRIYFLKAKIRVVFGNMKQDSHTYIVELTQSLSSTLP